MFDPRTIWATARRHSVWLTAIAVPLILAACNNGGSGGSGY
ncbi:MAG TPA: hypothetical protein VFI28_00760 [Candidatus Limnocylindrales bacterium]|nr:hypothetical protein [Candidatus Limnocylindrales bacterium]